MATSKGNPIRFCYITKAAFDTLSTKDSDTIYFVKETQNLYRGNDKYTLSIQIITSTELNKLSSSGYDPSVLYIISNNNNLTGEIKKSTDGTDLITIHKGYITEIPDTINNENYDVPTAKAVRTLVDAAKTELQQSLVVTGGKYDSSIECILLTLATDGSFTKTTPTPSTIDSTTNYGYTSDVIVIPTKNLIEEFTFQKSSTAKNIFITTTRKVDGNSIVETDFNISQSKNGTATANNIVFVDTDEKSIKDSGYSINSSSTIGTSTTTVPSESVVSTAISNSISNALSWEITE